MKNVKLKILLTVILSLILISNILNISYSATNKVTMSVVEEPICTINFGNNSMVERKVISKDLDNKEIVMQLKVKNNETSIKPSGEIMLVIDNSASMDEQVESGEVRKSLVLNSAKALVNNLLDNNSNLKIGAVSFSTGSNEGTITDASLVSELTNDSNTLISAISSITTRDKTNLSAGLRLAKQYFSDNTDTAHKYVIVLTDGIPNVALDYNKQYYSDDVIQKTKNELLSLSSISDNVIVVLTGITNGDNIAEPAEKTFNQIREEIFGTTEDPTIGKFYNIEDSDIEKTITNDIYNDLVPVAITYKDIMVQDVFTQEVVDNFDFSYVKDANIGTISPKIDTQTNSITWNIPELKSGEEAIVQYKLKLKDSYDPSIIDKVLDTNSRLNLTYKTPSDSQDSKTSDITPKLKLTEIKPKEVLPSVYPKAGKIIIGGIIALVLIISIVLGIRYYSLKTK